MKLFIIMVLAFMHRLSSNAFKPTTFIITQQRSNALFGRTDEILQSKNSNTCFKSAVTSRRHSSKSVDEQTQPSVEAKGESSSDPEKSPWTFENVTNVKKGGINKSRFRQREL